MKEHTYTRERLIRDWIDGKVALCELRKRRDTLQHQLDEIRRELDIIKDALPVIHIACDCYTCRNDPNNH